MSIISLGLIYIYWDSINELFKNVKPSDGNDTSDSSSNGRNSPLYMDPQEVEYRKYFKEVDENQELYDLDVVRSQDKGKAVDYSEVENIKWEDSPTTPKPSKSFELPKDPGIMLPISKEK